MLEQCQLRHTHTRTQRRTQSNPTWPSSSDHWYVSFSEHYNSNFVNDSLNQLCSSSTPITTHTQTPWSSTLYSTHRKLLNDNHLSSKTKHSCRRVGGEWPSSAAHPSRWTHRRGLLLAWSVSDLDGSHYGGIAPRGRAGPDWLSSTPWGLCFLQQVGQPWSNLGSRRLIPPVSNPHTSESCSTAGGLNITVHCQGPADTRSYNSCIQLLFFFSVVFPGLLGVWWTFKSKAH